MKKAQIKKSVSALAMAAVIAVSLFGYGCGTKSTSAGVSGDFTGTAKGCLLYTSPSPRDCS